MIVSSQPPEMIRSPEEVTEVIVAECPLRIFIVALNRSGAEDRVNSSQMVALLDARFEVNNDADDLSG